MRKKPFLNIVKILLYIAFISGIALSLTLPYLSGKNFEKFAEVLFAVSLSGLIGISTNTIAINMLFRPLNKTFFGRQGLLPKNKEKIAQTLAETVKEKIINRKAIISHLTEEGKLEEIVKKINKLIENALKDKENQKKILKLLEKIKKEQLNEENIEKIINFLSNQIDEYLETKELSFAYLFSKARNSISKQKQTNPIIKETIELFKTIIKKTVRQNSHEIALRINKALDSYLYENNFFAFMGKQFFIDETTLLKKITNFLEDEKSLKEAGEFTEKLLESLDTVLEDKEIKTKSEQLFEKGKKLLATRVKEKDIPAIINFINTYLDNFFNNPEKMETLSNQIETLLLSAAKHIEQYLKQTLTPEKIDKMIAKMDIEKTVYSIVYNSIIKQDMEEFEQLTKKIMSDNLAFIEIVGGILGMLIGISLTYRIALIIIPSAISIFILTDNFLTKITKPKKHLKKQ